MGRFVVFEIRRLVGSVLVFGGGVQILGEGKGFLWESLNLCVHCLYCGAGIMVNITVSVPEELYEKMRRFSEVKWSEIVRRALVEYVMRLEVVERGVVSSEDLARMLKESGFDVDSISLEKAIDYYEKARELEWKRLSTIQARS